jgi:hypothetical protein
MVMQQKRRKGIRERKQRGRGVDKGRREVDCGW